MWQIITYRLPIILEARTSCGSIRGGFRVWQIIGAILFFPLGLLTLFIGRKNPQPAQSVGTRGKLEKNSVRTPGRH